MTKFSEAARAKAKVGYDNVRSANLATPDATKHERVIFAAQQRLTPADVPTCPICEGRMALGHAAKQGGYFWRCANPGARFKCWGSRAIDQEWFACVVARPKS